MYKTIISLLIFSFFTVVSYAQTDTLLYKRNAISLYLNPHFGFVMPSAKNVEYLGQSHVQGIETGIEYKTRGKKYWHKAYNFPAYGFVFCYFGLNNIVLGNFMTLVAYKSLNLVTKGNFNLKFRIGTGIGHTTNKFDKATNHRNRIIGSEFGAIMHGGLDASYTFAQRHKISAKLFITHMSNGSYTLPNYGINVPTISAGYAYYLTDPSKINNPDLLIPEYKKWIFDAGVGIGFKEVYPTGGEKYSATKISLNCIYRIGFKSGISAGFDGFNDTSLKTYIKDKIYANTPDTKRIGFVIGHELYVNKLTLVTLYGTYVYNQVNFLDYPHYQRYGMKYHFHKNIYAGVMLKTHRARADNLEWTVGFRL